MSFDTTEPMQYESQKAEEVKTMAHPTIIIGLGGTGQWVLTYLKKDLVSTCGKAPDSIQVLSFDSDSPRPSKKEQEPIDRHLGQALYQKLFSRRIAHTIPKCVGESALSSFMVCSLAGGTGSGMLIDVAQMVRQASSGGYDDPQPVAAGKQGVKTNLLARSFAALRELDKLSRAVLAEREISGQATTYKNASVYLKLNRSDRMSLTLAWKWMSEGLGERIVRCDRVAYGKAELVEKDFSHPSNRRRAQLVGQGKRTEETTRTGLFLHDEMYELLDYRSGRSGKEGPAKEVRDDEHKPIKRFNWMGWTMSVPAAQASTFSREIPVACSTLMGTAVTNGLSNSADSEAFSYKQPGRADGVGKRDKQMKKVNSTTIEEVLSCGSPGIIFPQSDEAQRFRETVVASWSEEAQQHLESISQAVRKLRYQLGEQRSVFASKLGIDEFDLVMIENAACPVERLSEIVKRVDEMYFTSLAVRLQKVCKEVKLGNMP